MTGRYFRIAGLYSALAFTLFAYASGNIHAQAQPVITVDRAGDSPVNSDSRFSYADLADLADPAELIVHAQVRKQATLEPERAPNVPPDQARLYIESRTRALLSGLAPIGESLRYLVDVKRDARGKVPKLKKSQVIVFARVVPGDSQALQLVAPDAQLPWSAQLEARLRAILRELVAPDSPPRVSGVRDALSVSGNLAGESETQVFLEAESLETGPGAPASITIVRRPGQAPRWGVSWSEIVDQSARPPARDTMAWYRLACFLPPALPPSANLSSDGKARSRAQQDYQFVIEQLGPCLRNRAA